MVTVESFAAPEDPSPVGFEPCVAVLGMFDGVHLGHQRLVAIAVEEARQMDLPASAITFDPHPLRVIAPDRAPKLLTTREVRIRLLLRAGLDEVKVINFDDELASWTPNQFASSFLRDRLKVRKAVVGRNFRFGAGATGTPQDLAKCLSTTGGSVHVETLREVNGRQISSTAIRDELGRGNVEWAAEALGRFYFVDGLFAEQQTHPELVSHPTIQLPAVGQYAGNVLMDHAIPTTIWITPDSRIRLHIDDLGTTDQSIRVEFKERL